MMIRCECAVRYSIEPHGAGFALYHGRCGHRHGYNLVYLLEPAHNFDVAQIENLLNLGASYQRMLDVTDENS